MVYIRTLLNVSINFLFMFRLIYSQTAELSDIYEDYKKKGGFCLNIIKYFQIYSQFHYGEKFRKHMCFFFK